MLLTAADIAKRLRVDRRRVYELMRTPAASGGIPHYEIGTTKRVDPTQFEKWLEGRKVQ